MSTPESHIAPIVERIENAAAKEIKVVRGTGDFLAARKGAISAVPAVFVTPFSETAGANSTGTQMVRQFVTLKFQVIIAVTGNEIGGASVDPVTGPRRAVKDALIGWRHPIAKTSTVFAGGRLAAWQAPYLWWTDFFEFQFFETHSAQRARR